MSRPEGESPHYVKRVVLPSGKTIDIVYFRDAVAEQAGSAGELEATALGGSSFEQAPEPTPPAEPRPPSDPQAEPHQDLHVCGDCTSTLVYPIAWEEAGRDAWSVTLRCPECETHREGVFAQATVDAFDEELDSASESLTADYRRLCRSNMAEEIDRFAAALQANALLPEDF